MVAGQRRKALIVDELPKDGVVRFSEFSRMVGFASRATLQKKLKAGEFPRPKRVNGHVRYWSAADIREYIDGRREWKGEARA